MSRLILDETAEIGVDSRGLVRGEDTVAEWRDPDGPLPWAVEDWQPEPEIVACAQLGEWAAVLARVGRHAQLGVRRDGRRPDWHGLSKSPEDMNRGMVGATLLGPLRLAEVTAVTRREDLIGVQVQGARRVQQIVVPRHVENPPGDALDPALARHAVTAIAAQAPGAPLDLPDELTRDLQRLLHRKPFRTTWIAVGLRVAETWELPGGFQVPVVYDVEPGQVQGFVVDEATGAPHSTLQACRNHHLSGRPAWCSYCLSPTCGACAEAVRPCRLCQGAVCGDCVATADGRCPACARLTRVGMLARGRYGVSGGGSVWHGEVPNVQVTIREQRNYWTLERWDRYDRVTFPLDPPTIHALREWVKTS
ncbi:hypothetical protein ACWT_5599 [Actinoplanes sp. SE50]|uniref:hypothetical protein n=1 Tax=unclassified Actinoplanes TaxID=2626549 RepID=UPI00023ECF1E|nr:MULTISPECIES: hypothetical protein [unclassified Actinoplanes]AEV86616.1 hypothetical protein ACPL_5729 [Actinoplanes sp. SE50/110]ATO85014.1 hypothetical protein ACWT_5599 [Actinoplanes sp. SE50]SLM02423.1 hypothetical protein ACSP50_5672 [Actinoplanes sp. SE50/110]